MGHESVKHTLLILVLVTILVLAGWLYIRLLRDKKTIIDENDELVEGYEYIKRIPNEPDMYNKKTRVEEKWIDTHIDSWEEIRMIHPILNDSFLYAIVSDFGELEFVKKWYIAGNGIVRLEIEGGERFFGDITVHPGEGNLLIMRNGKREYIEFENNIRDLIVEKVDVMVKNIER